MKLSSDSPLQWLTIIHNPAALESSATQMDSVTRTIWLTCNYIGEILDKIRIIMQYFIRRYDDDQTQNDYQKLYYSSPV